MLIVNDHLLKVLYPSVLTGKISDFTGLYFFPFIIALLLSLILDRLGNYQRLIGNFSFLMTAVAFTLVKTVPWANAGMESLLPSLTGRVSEIAMDPTDLIALIILLPSWRLWNRRAIAVPTQYAWLVFGIASLASMATSYIEIDRITHLLVQDDAIYVGGPDMYSPYVSYDKGMTWEDALDVPDAFYDQLGIEPVLPKSICAAVDINQCFRISGQEYVEISRDGGLSWEIDWEVPPSRRPIMGRLSTGLLGAKDIDLGPYDITLVGSGEDRVVIVAMGNEGVLIGDVDNDWRRQEVGSASPTPFSADDPFDVIWVIPMETAFLPAGALLGWVVLNWLFLRPVLSKLDGSLPPARGLSWFYKPGKWLFGSFVFLLVGGNILQQAIGIPGMAGWL
jgi:hypothetical protein